MRTGQKFWWPAPFDDEGINGWSQPGHQGRVDLGTAVVEVRVLERGASHLNACNLHLQILRFLWSAPREVSR